MQVTAPAQTYRTECEIKRSTFIATLKRVSTLEEARAFVSTIRAEYPDARHTCSAFLITVPGAGLLSRSNDDGEPSGTAGRPMLDVLTGSGLVDVAVTVTRYFGGILLGTGGLVRAYSDSVAEVLAICPRYEVQNYEAYRVRLPIGVGARVLSALHGAGFLLLEEKWGESLELVLTHPQRDASEVGGFLSSLAGSRVHLEPAGIHRVEVPL